VPTRNTSARPSVSKVNIASAMDWMLRRRQLKLRTPADVTVMICHNNNSDNSNNSNNSKRQQQKLLG